MPLTLFAPPPRAHDDLAVGHDLVVLVRRVGMLFLTNAHSDLGRFLRDPTAIAGRSTGLTDKPRRVLQGGPADETRPSPHVLIGPDAFAGEGVEFPAVIGRSAIQDGIGRSPIGER